MIPAAVTEKARSFLEEHSGREVVLGRQRALSGGCIHHAHAIETTAGPYFLKWNGRAEAPGFLAELKGLRLLAGHSHRFTAVPLTADITGDHSFLLLEFIEEGTVSGGFWKTFGQKMAELHQATAPSFGLDHDNYIGSLPQSNRQHPDFVSFFIAERLEPQLRRALDTGLADYSLYGKFRQLFHRLPGLLPTEKPALLHGDLWSGNFLCDSDGQPRIIDPAVHYGHREAELAFTTLFGGFDPVFYEAYHEAFPLQKGWQERAPLFNLYPLLVHLNLFGRSYLAGIRRSLDLFS